MDEELDLNPSAPVETNIHLARCPEDDKAFYSKLKELWNHGTVCDITLSAKGALFQAHRLILLACSTSLTDDILANSDQPNITLELDVDPESLGIVLNYIYHNEVPVRKEQLPIVAKTAKQLGIMNLWKKCLTDHLASMSVSVTNCLQMWEEAHWIEHEDLKNKAMQFALANFASVKETEAYKSLPCEIMETYICHEDLEAESLEERLTSALAWTGTDSTRRRSLKKVVDTLPVRQLDQKQIKALLDQPALQAHAEIWRKIRALVEGVIDAERQKADVEPPLVMGATPLQMTEKCLVFVGGGVEGKRNDDVKVIRLQHEYRMIELGRLGASYPDGLIKYGFTNCCVYENRLYGCGVGSKGNEIWSFNLETGASALFARTHTQRHCQAVFADKKGRIFIFGGQTLSIFPKETNAVEMVDTSSCGVKELGPLPFGSPKRQFCVDLNIDFKVLVCGGKNNSGHNVLQLYGCEDGKVLHTIELPFSVGDHAYGAVLAYDHVVVVMKHRTVVLKLEDVLSGSTTTIKICDNYVIPNKACAVVKDSDEQRILLFGGKPKETKCKCYAYQANISDVLSNSNKGWEPAAVPWTLGECMFVGGYSVADIQINPKHSFEA